MNRIKVMTVLALGAMLVFASGACDKKDKELGKAGPNAVPQGTPSAGAQAVHPSQGGGMGAQGMPAGHPPVGGAAGGAAAADQPGAMTGTVLETMEAGGYTYAQLDMSGQKVWVAASKMELAKGETLTIGGASLMKGFTSKTLNRTFDEIYFASSATKGGAAAAPAAGDAAAPAAGGAAADAPADLKTPGNTAAAEKAAIDEPIAKAEGPEGKTVAEVYAGKAELSGKVVAIRGKVTKFNGGIMGKNWVHLQDGSGAEGTNDLTATTQDTANVGDVVVVKGTVATDKDFGGGYKYALIIEEAKVTK